MALKLVFSMPQKLISTKALLLMHYVPFQGWDLSPQALPHRVAYVGPPRAGLAPLGRSE